MKKITLSIFVFGLFLTICVSQPALADPLAGDACAVEGSSARTGGAESSGAGSFLVCESGTWKAILSFNGLGQVTTIGNQTCADGEILMSSSGVWVCGANGGGSGGGGGGGDGGGIQVFTSSDTFTVPDGVSSIRVFVVGGGGGGGTSTGNGNEGKNGGLGGRALKWLTGLTPGEEITVTIGTGGAGRSGWSQTGGAGSASSFGVHVSASGGGGGGHSQGATGSPGSGAGGDLNTPADGVDLAYGRKDYGNGGSGGMVSSNAGKPGVIVVEWFGGGAM